ncbi:hypothetical protein J6590_053172 [Homalodisca vitripennis]|nr:hypothetical protein J6590_053172 [Homalodisca vitripennis]
MGPTPAPGMVAAETQDRLSAAIVMLGSRLYQLPLPDQRGSPVPSDAAADRFVAPEDRVPLCRGLPTLLLLLIPAVLCGSQLIAPLLSAI